MQNRKPSFYEILGLNPAVTAAEIKLAYRKLVKQCHPDIDYKKQTSHERNQSHERMKRINEAYETLIDKTKRLDYDHKIGATPRGLKGSARAPGSFDTEEIRERYLKSVFNPSRRTVVKILKEYNSRLNDLSQDIYDDLLLEEFQTYVTRLETTLLKASNNYTQSPAPASLSGAEQWMRHSIAQAADGLDELNEFLINFDYYHLSMAKNLFKIAIEHSKVALNLTRL